MSVSDQFVAGLVELGEQHNQINGASTTNRKHKSKQATTCKHNEYEHNKVTGKQKL
jgi:hypothetical protein